MEKLLVIDGNSLLNRAYYAFGTGSNELSHNGMPTNATYGFLNMLFRGLEDIRPTHLVVTFDVRGKTFRHEICSDYKATRKGMPDDLAVQLGDLKKLLEIMNIKILEKQGFEADDIIGTLAKRNLASAIILTADRDAFQLVDDKTELHLTKTGVTNTDIWTTERVKAEMGVTPNQIIDIKALQGDKSDNIPGAAGIGEKTAMQLIQDFGNIENLYNSLATIKESTRQKLESSRDNVFKSKILATINTSVPIELRLNDFALRFPLEKPVFDAFAERGFKSLLKRKNIWADEFATTPTEIQKPIAVTQYEIKDLSTLESYVKTFDKKQIAISYDQSAFYLATDVGSEHKITVFMNMLDGGIDFEQILLTLAPILEGDCEKLVFDSKGFKELLATRNIKLYNVKLDAKLYFHLLTSRTNIERITDILPGNAAALFSVDYETKLRSVGMWELYHDMELLMVDVLLEMQNNGVKVNLQTLTEVAGELSTEINDISNEIYAKIGETFNINSPKVLGDILFKRLGLQTVVKTKTGYSTNEETLQKIKDHHPVVPLILRYRHLFKLQSGFVQSFKSHMREDGLVHTTFNNTGTVTGRLSSSEPNIQNIPKRSDSSDRVRKIFTSRFDGGKLLCADYSQIELRILAHLSKDENMIASFQSGQDIHTQTALKIFGSTDNKLRRYAKAVNFGIVYGLSAYGLSQSINVSTSDAALFIQKYFDQFPKIKSYLDSCRDFAIEKGYVKTIMGRRRYIPEISSQNHQTVQFGTRVAMNMPMQGSAADIVKMAMVRIFDQMKSKKMKSLIIAQVHDELVFDCPPDEINQISDLVKNEMEKVIKLSVELKVDIEIKETL
ncbi:MAG: DNA polymerase I [Firmicutes bacterium]|nr:DNA polymerase I [Bacillota bacterium]